MKENLSLVLFRFTGGYYLTGGNLNILLYYYLEWKLFLLLPIFASSVGNFDVKSYF